ncbi:hypothetical protein OIDMADRAFT_40966 [Oidiodendron maius Zn]|uniref:Uncharacterized protein n=1 Tax=Oidiodendron maius (strain Zn) TaxID=913774 RepID=A0A0C3HHA6_OIDMZ|nr:hypothetical protein OIDMADRAFT_40966 [Oidiodendron maius Zn]
MANASSPSCDPAAHGQLLQAINRLTLAVETPTETNMRILYQPVQNACIRMAIGMGLPHAVVARDGVSVTAAELGEELKADPVLIARVMRVLTAAGLCKEDGPNQYSATPVTRSLAGPAFTGGSRYIFDLFFPTAAQLPEYLLQTNFENPQGKSAFEFTYQTGLWEHLGENPDLQRDCVAYMRGRRAGQLRWLDIYPVEAELAGKTADDSVLLVDIGGNQGHDLELFKERYPKVPGRLILQDLPEAIERISPPLEGIEVIPYDFFTPQPIESAQLYFFRGICHDWSDEQCQKFLSNTVRAMNKNSRLLVNEFVLPNTGAGQLQASLDIMMMTLVSGLERTEMQWQSLLESVGLEIVKIWSIMPEIEAVIETRLKE